MINFYTLVFCLLYIFDAYAQDLVIQSTTSTRDSGLYEYLLPQYPQRDTLSIKVVAVGTGQAIINAKNCDGDLLIVHDKNRELEFLNKGYGIKRHSLMYLSLIHI